MKTTFNFRTIKKTDSRHAELLAAANAGLCTVTTDATDGSICRDSIEAELPELQVTEFPPAFLANIISELVEKAAKKLYVDRFLPIGQVGVAEVIAACTPAPRASTAIPEAVWTSFTAYITQVLTDQGTKAGTVSTILALLKGRFKSATCVKYAAQQAAFPVILDALVRYVNRLATMTDVEGAAEAAIQFKACTDQLEGNYAKWLESLLADTEELDMDAL